MRIGQVEDEVDVLLKSIVEVMQTFFFPIWSGSSYINNQKGANEIKVQAVDSCFNEEKYVQSQNLVRIPFKLLWVRWFVLVQADMLDFISSFDLMGSPC